MNKSRALKVFSSEEKEHILNEYQRIQDDIKTLRDMLTSVRVHKRFFFFERFDDNDFKAVEEAVERNPWCFIWTYYGPDSDEFKIYKNRNFFLLEELISLLDNSTELYLSADMSVLVSCLMCRAGDLPFPKEF